MPQVHTGLRATLTFQASLLQLRGRTPLDPPHRDADGNILLFNGEHQPAASSFHDADLQQNAMPALRLQPNFADPCAQGPLQGVSQCSIFRLERTCLESHAMSTDLSERDAASYTFL